MKMKVLLTSVCLVYALSAVGQVGSRMGFSKEDLQKFTRVHQYILDHPFDLVESMERNVKQLRISGKRLAEIFLAQAKGEKVVLNKKESQALGKLKLLIAKDKIAYDKEMVSYMRAQKMELSRYQSIEKAYRKSTPLQAEIQRISNN